MKIAKNFKFNCQKENIFPLSKNKLDSKFISLINAGFSTIRPRLKINKIKKETYSDKLGLSYDQCTTIKPEELVDNKVGGISNPYLNSHSLRKYKYALPIILLPLQFHTAACLVDYFIYGSFYFNSFQLYLKHSFLIICFNEGLNIGFYDGTKIADSIIITERLIRLITLFLCLVSLYFILSFSMKRLYFNISFTTFIYTSYYLLENINISTKLPKTLRKILLICNLIMMALINIQYEKYKKNIADTGKFEDALKLHQQSSDQEFIKNIKKYEDYLDDIDIKLEKRKD